jgi:hypothetical protein
LEVLSIFVEHYIVILLILLSYCEYVPLSAITNMPLCYTFSASL